MTFEEELVGLRPYLRRVALTLTKSADAADDLVQDTLLKALTKRHLFTMGTSLAAWTTVIMRNHYFSERRKASRLVEDPDETHQRTLSMQATQEWRLHAMDLVEAFGRLPQAMQGALYNVGLLGESYEDTAENLNLPIGTIKSQVSRARTKLETLLKSEPIYKLDTAGRLRSWFYEVDGDKWRSTSGLVDGAQTTTEWTVCTAKSQPTAEAQAIFEAAAEGRKKLERQYHLTPEACSKPNFFEPMLAKGYKGKLKFPVANQPKLDGIRCIATAEGLFTRQGKPIVDAGPILPRSAV